MAHFTLDPHRLIRVTNLVRTMRPDDPPVTSDLVFNLIAGDESTPMTHRVAEQYQAWLDTAPLSTLAEFACDLMAVTP